MSYGRVNQRILILCEGLTEYIYAKSLQKELPRDKQRAIAVEVFYQQSLNDPKSLALEARKKVEAAKRDRNPYGEVWLFFDNDNSPHIPKAFEISAKEGFRLAYSAICLEHWFILHFENCGKAFFSGDEALKYLMKLWPEYHKTKSNAFLVLRDKIEIAMKRAEIIIKNQPVDIPIYKQNPYFTVPELIRFFDELKKAP